MSVTTADCDLLGRGSVQGSADSDSLAALVRQLCKQQQRGRFPGRRCTVSCSRDAGLEIAPYQRKRPDDEGFESDEDLTSLGSYEDPTKRKMGQLAAASVAAGAGSDSANSSGVSEDSDDADAASLKGQTAIIASSDTAVTGSVAIERETYGLADVAFCHTDATALPGIAVWVIKNRRPLTAGLEAIVVQSRDNRLQAVCRAYQEHSRRLKLEPKLWVGHPNSVGATQRRKVGSAVTLTATPEVNRYNLVQRTDTDGVMHIEVTTGTQVNPTADSRRATIRDGSPSNIISISTPESPRMVERKDRDRDEAEEDENVDCDNDNGDDQLPPQRPERRKYKSKLENGTSDSCSTSSSNSGSDDLRQKVVRGQFIRVNVNHCAALPSLSPEPDRKSVRSPQSIDIGSKPTAAYASDRLWSTADYDRPDGRHEQHRRSSRSTTNRTRSRSSGPGRRSQPLQLAPAHPPPVAFSRYPPVEAQQPSFGNRFFGKLREITTGSQSPPPTPDLLQPTTFRRRNSVGEAATANFYQYFSHNHQHHYQHHHNQYQQQQQNYHQQMKQQAKNVGNLKSVIKKNNKSQPYQHAFDEPKKVTFSAYATVQVVD